MNFLFRVQEIRDGDIVRQKMLSEIPISEVIEIRRVHDEIRLVLVSGREVRTESAIVITEQKPLAQCA